MISADTLPSRRRLVADGPHLVAACSSPAGPVRPRVSLADELVDSQTALTALQSVAGPQGTNAARVLRYLCARSGQRGTADVLDRWIAHRARDAAAASQ